MFWSPIRQSIDDVLKISQEKKKTKVGFPIDTLKNEEERKSLIKIKNLNNELMNFLNDESVVLDLRKLVLFLFINTSISLGYTDEDKYKVLIKDSGVEREIVKMYKGLKHIFMYDNQFVPEYNQYGVIKRKDEIFFQSLVNKCVLLSDEYAYSSFYDLMSLSSNGVEFTKVPNGFHSSNEKFEGFESDDWLNDKFNCLPINLLRFVCSKKVSGEIFGTKSDFARYRKCLIRMFTESSVRKTSLAITELKGVDKTPFFIFDFIRKSLLSLSIDDRLSLYSFVFDLNHFYANKSNFTDKKDFEFIKVIYNAFKQYNIINELTVEGKDVFRQICISCLLKDIFDFSQADKKENTAFDLIRKKLDDVFSKASQLPDFKNHFIVVCDSFSENSRAVKEVKKGFNHYFLNNAFNFVNFVNHNPSLLSNSMDRLEFFVEARFNKHLENKESKEDNTFVLNITKKEVEKIFLGYVPFCFPGKDFSLATEKDVLFASKENIRRLSDLISKYLGKKLDFKSHEEDYSFFSIDNLDVLCRELGGTDSGGVVEKLNLLFEMKLKEGNIVVEDDNCNDESKKEVVIRSKRF